MATSSCSALTQQLQQLQLNVKGVCQPLLPLGLSKQLVKLSIDWCKFEMGQLQEPLLAALMNCCRLELLSLVGYQGQVDQVGSGHTDN